MFALVACASAPPPPSIPALLAAGRAAYQRKDYAEYLRTAEVAVSRSPANPDLAYRVARGLALTGRAAESVARLGELAALRLSYDLDADRDLDALRARADYAAVRTAMEVARQPVRAGTAAFTLAAPDLIAEALGWDPVTGSFFVSSVHQRRIFRVDGAGGVTDFTPTEESHWGLFGLVVDAPRRRLWVGTGALPQVDGYTSADEGRAAVLRINLDSGKVEERYEAPGRGHVFGDLGLAPNGDVWISDSVGGGVWRIPVVDSALTQVIAPGVLRSPQGIAVSADGAQLYIADYTSGLHRYDIAARRLTPLPLPESTLRYGIDGLLRHGDALYGVLNGVAPYRLVRFELAADRVARVTLIESGPDLVAPTSGVVANGALYYVAVSQWESFGDDGTRKVDVPVVIRRIDL